MVNIGYPFLLKDKRGASGNFLMNTYIYVFHNCKNQKYIINVENYKYDFYHIKFHLKNHTASKNKYRIQTNTFDAFRIISTCFNVLFHIFEKNRYASFGFIGMSSKNEKIKENKQNKRFRIYRRKALNLFSENDFIHVENLDNNAYFLINRHNPEINLQDKIKNMINDYCEIT
jgi:hypothetical protein